MGTSRSLVSSPFIAFSLSLMGTCRFSFQNSSGINSASALTKVFPSWSKTPKSAGASKL